jgi:hypothetical protein
MTTLTYARARHSAPLPVLLFALSTIVTGACATTLQPAADLDRDGVGDVADRCPAEREDGGDPDPADGCRNLAQVTP